MCSLRGDVSPAGAGWRAAVIRGPTARRAEFQGKFLCRGCDADLGTRLRDTAGLEVKSKTTAMVS